MNGHAVTIAAKTIADSINNLALAVAAVALAVDNNSGRAPIHTITNFTQTVKVRAE